MAGFECSTGLNRHRHWIDQVQTTHHDRRIMEDYTSLYSLGIRVIREGVRWPLIDRGDHFDFTSLDPFLTRARYVGMQVVFDMLHFGYPANLDPLTDEFIERFAAYCRAAAQHIRANLDGPLVFIPVNQPSYLAWAGGSAGMIAPYLTGNGWELKVQLTRAAIAGIDAIREVVPHARFINTDPLCRVQAPRGRPDLQDDANWFNENVVYQSWDMLAGRLMPELGGSLSHLDIVGPSYYAPNQWEQGHLERTITEDDPRWTSLSEMLQDLWHRYGCEMVLSETGAIGDSRRRHLEWVADEVESLLNVGIPIRSVCLHPVLGMTDWHEPNEWLRMGIWDVDEEGGRHLHEPSLAALRYGQRRLENREIPRDLLIDGPYMG